MTGNDLLDKVLLGISTFVVLAVLGLFAYSVIIYKKPLPVDSVEMNKLKKEGIKHIIPPSFKMSKITVNLPTTNGKLRFLDLELHIIPFEANDVKQLEKRLTFINDIIIDVCSKITPEELNSISGKIILEERLKKRINQHFQITIIKSILFTHFVIQ